MSTDTSDIRPQSTPSRRVVSCLSRGRNRFTAPRLDSTRRDTTRRSVQVLYRCRLCHLKYQLPRQQIITCYLFIYLLPPPCLFVSKITQKKLLNRFSQNSAERWHIWATEETIIDLGGNSCHVTLRLRLG